MQRDVLVWAQSKLSGPWSAGEITGSLTSELLVKITDDFDRLEPLVRVRLLISCAFLTPTRRQDLADELRALAKKASHDDHEWVRMYGLVLGDMDGRMHLPRALEAFPVVRSHFAQLNCSARLSTSRQWCMPCSIPNARAHQSSGALTTRHQAQ